MYRHDAHVIAIVYRDASSQTDEIAVRRATIPLGTLYVFVDGKQADAREAPPVMRHTFDQGGAAFDLADINGGRYHWPDLPIAAQAWLDEESERVAARYRLEAMDPTRWDSADYRASVTRDRALLGI